MIAITCTIMFYLLTFRLFVSQDTYNSLINKIENIKRYVSLILARFCNFKTKVYNHYNEIFYIVPKRYNLLGEGKDGIIKALVLISLIVAKNIPDLKKSEYLFFDVCLVTYIYLILSNKIAPYKNRRMTHKTFDRYIRFLREDKEFENYKRKNKRFFRAFYANLNKKNEQTIENISDKEKEKDNKKYYRFRICNIELKYQWLW